MTVLVVAEHDECALKEVTLNAVMAACQISMYTDGQIHVLVAGQHVGAVALAAAQIDGVGKVVVAEGPHLRHSAKALAEQVRKLSGAYTHVLFSATVAGNRGAGHVAHVLGTRPRFNIHRVLSAEAFEGLDIPVPGNADGPVGDRAAVRVLSVNPCAFEAVASGGGIGMVECSSQHGWRSTRAPWLTGTTALCLCHQAATRPSLMSA